MVSSALRHPDSTSLFHHYIGMQYTIPQQGIPPLHRVNDIKHSLPVEGGSHREPLANDLLMYWTEQYWEAHGLAQTPPISTPV